MNYTQLLVTALKEHNMTIATAESCTGGLIAKMITDISGASAVFNCGIISYSNEIKMSVLKVNEDTLKNFGAVSEQTVTEMSLGVAKISGADISVAVSGIAGPDSDGTNKPVGLIYIAINLNGRIIIKKLYNQFSENIRNNNRITAANEAIKSIYELLTEEIGFSD